MTTQRILIVDDHADTLAMLARLLSGLGHQVTAAASCAGARAAAGDGFDLLLCDVGLPDGDGAALMGEVKQRWGCRTVALTGFGMESDLARYAA